MAKQKKTKTKIDPAVARIPASNSPLLDSKAAAAYLGISEGTLAVWRCVGRYGLRWIKLGKLIRYRQIDLDEFLESRTCGAGRPQMTV